MTYISSISASALTTPAESAYSMRAATISDLPILESLVVSSRGSTELFSGVSSSDALRSQLEWMLGQRPPPFDGESPIYDNGPFFLLNKGDRTVAAAGLSKKPNPKTSSPSIVVHPLLWDGKEDASKTVVALVQHIVPAINNMLAAGGCSEEWVLYGRVHIRDS